MAIRELLQRSDPRLKKENQVVTDVANLYILQVINDLIETMHAANLIGIAAPQIGENVLIFVTEPRETDARPKDQADVLRVYINPQIVESSQEQVVIWEACGCVDHATSFGPVSRPKITTIEAMDKEGKLFQLKADGILGRVIQHEQHHLQGKEFVDVMPDISLLIPKQQYIKDIKDLAQTKENALINIKEYRRM